MSASHASDPKPLKADIVIIGAGIPFFYGGGYYYKCGGIYYARSGGTYVQVNVY